MKVKEIYRLLLSDIRYKKVGLRFITCICVTFITTIVGNYTDIIFIIKEPMDLRVEDILFYIVQSGFLLPISMISASIIAVTPFYEDRKTRFVQSILCRVSKKSYLVGRILGCAFMAYMSICVPFYIAVVYLTSRIPRLNVSLCLLIISNYAVYVSLWCLWGLLLSAWVMNIHVIITAPFILSYVVGRISYSLVPNYLNPNEYMQSYLLGNVMEGKQNLITVCGYIEALVLTILVSFLFYRKANRELENEV